MIPIQQKRGLITGMFMRGLDTTSIEERLPYVFNTLGREFIVLNFPLRVIKSGLYTIARRYIFLKQTIEQTIRHTEEFRRALYAI